MRKPSVRAMQAHVAFARRIEINPDAPNDYGNTVGAWQEQFQSRAQYIHLRGGEAVMAGRLQGRHTQVIRVRATALTRQVATDWKVTDVQSGVEFNIRDISPSDDRRWLDMLAESGVAV